MELIKAELEEAKSKGIELQNGKRESFKTPAATQNTICVITSDLSSLSMENKCKDLCEKIIQNTWIE